MIAIAEVVILGYQAQIFVDTWAIFCKERMTAPFLLDIGDHPEETVFTQMKFVPLTIVSRPVTPARMNNAVLVRTCFNPCRASTGVAKHINDGFYFGFADNLYGDLVARGERYSLPWQNQGTLVRA